MALDSAISTSNAMANDLLTSSGMAGMLNTVWLILCAMVFGATMQATRMLERITQAILSGVQSTFGFGGQNGGHLPRLQCPRIRSIPRHCSSWKHAKGRLC